MTLGIGSVSGKTNTSTLERTTHIGMRLIEGKMDQRNIEEGEKKEKKKRRQNATNVNYFNLGNIVKIT